MIKLLTICLSQLIGVGLLSASSQELLPITSGGKTLYVEVALTKEEQVKGLMFRDHLEPNRGMLFVFEEPKMYCMWMRNTLIPLEVAFLDAKGRIINIDSMAPETENLHCSKEPALYALETVPRWFEKAGLQTGDCVVDLSLGLEHYLKKNLPR